MPSLRLLALAVSMSVTAAACAGAALDEAPRVASSVAMSPPQGRPDAGGDLDGSIDGAARGLAATAVDGASDGGGTPEQVESGEPGVRGVKGLRLDGTPIGDDEVDGASEALDGGRKPADVRLGRVEARGPLPPEVVLRIVRDRIGRLRACYKTALRAQPKLAGRIAVRFGIGRNGKVEFAKLEADELRSPAFAGCVQRFFEALVFPPPEGGPVEVLYPVNFE
jgi:hypothetical protein